MNTKHFTRRDFLKTMGYGAGATALSSMPFSCSKKPGYKPSREFVEDEYGSYELIRNPSEPLHGEMGSAAKVLEIGDPGLVTDADGKYVLTGGTEENYIFANIRDVSFKDDTIFVADRLEDDIRVFDIDGVYQRTFAGKGQGPGEISSWIDHLHVDDNGFLIRVSPVRIWPGVPFFSSLL